jgi:AraC-like DNA-binding protein
MLEHHHIDDLEFWHEVVCAHVIEAQCASLSDRFDMDFMVSRPSEIQFSRVRSSPHSFLREEKHVRNSSKEHVIVYLQVKGTGMQVQDGRELLVQPGDLVCADTTRPQHLYSTTSDNFDEVLIHIPRKLVIDSFGPTEQFTTMELSRRTQLGRILAPFLQNVGDVLDKVTNSAADQLSQIAVSLVMSAFAEQANAKLDHPTWSRQAILYRAKLYIQQRYRNHDLSPAMVAEAMRISVRHLQGIFQEAGTTPSDYIWKCRLENSKQELENPSYRLLSISEIATRNGFSQMSHFSVRFKEAFGVTPRECRLCAYPNWANKRQAVSFAGAAEK